MARELRTIEIAEDEFFGAELRFIQFCERDESAPKVRRPEDGRPRKIFALSQREAVLYLRAIRAGAHYKHAARFLGIGARTMIRWMNFGRADDAGKRRTVYRLFVDATVQAESFAIADCEQQVKKEDPKAWLARRARSAPGYVGWEPDALKVDMSLQGSAGGSPIRLRNEVAIADLRNEETMRLVEAMLELKRLGLATAANLIGKESSDDDDTEIEP